MSICKSIACHQLCWMGIGQLHFYQWNKLLFHFCRTPLIQCRIIPFLCLGRQTASTHLKTVFSSRSRMTGTGGVKWRLPSPHSHWIVKLPKTSLCTLQTSWISEREASGQKAIWGKPQNCRIFFHVSHAVMVNGFLCLWHPSNIQHVPIYFSSSRDFQYCTFFINPL